MEVSKGYKQTEVGVIPIDWDLHYFGEVVDYIKGYPFMSKNYVKYGIRVIRVSDTTFDSIRKENGNYVDVKNSQEYKNWALCENDLIFTTVGSKPPMYDSMVGKVIMVLKEFEGCLLNQNAVLIRSKKKQKENQILLLNHFRTKRYLQYVELIYRGNANQASITLRELFNFRIPLPKNESEQAAIATALSDTDALISSLEKLIAKKRNIKQGAMQELLKPKKGWEVKRLGDIAEVRDGTHQTPKYVEQGIPFYSVESVTNNNFTNTKFISEEEHRFLTKSFKIERGDILMTRIGSIGDCKLIDWDVNASFYVSLALLKIKKEFSANFIYHYSKSSAFRKEVELNSLQTAIPKKINLGPISSVKIQLPDFQEQNRIGSILTDLETEIEILETKLEKYKQIKSGMMQNLLTGKIRLV